MPRGSLARCGVLCATLMLGACAPSPRVCGDTVPLDHLAASLARAYCDCPSMAWVAAVTLGHVPRDCVGELTGMLEAERIGHLRAMVAAGARYRPDSVDACLCAISECSGFLVWPRDCDHFADGPSSDGGSCAFTDDCSTTSACARTSGCGGTCVHVPQPGDPCATSSECAHPVDVEEPRLECERGTCAMLPGAGEPCSGSGGCGPGTRCSGGSCRAWTRVETGGSCAENPNCAIAAVCIDGDAPMSRVCSPRRTDGVCRSAAGTADCALGESCVGATTTSLGTCAPAPGEGETCSTFFGICADHLRCDGVGGASVFEGTCARVSPTGATCRSNDECLGRFCNAGTCGPAPACL